MFRKLVTSFVILVISFGGTTALIPYVRAKEAAPANNVKPFEINKKITCGGPKDTLENLRNEYGESIIFASKDIEGQPQIALFHNHRTGGWTVIEFITIKSLDGTVREYACILETGYSGVVNLKGIAERHL